MRLAVMAVLCLVAQGFMIPPPLSLKKTMPHKDRVRDIPSVPNVVASMSDTKQTKNTPSIKVVVDEAALKANAGSPSIAFTASDSLNVKTTTQGLTVSEMNGNVPKSSDPLPSSPMSWPSKPADSSQNLEKDQVVIHASSGKADAMPPPPSNSAPKVSMVGAPASSEKPVLDSYDFDVDYVISYFNSHDKKMTENYVRRLSAIGTRGLAPDALDKRRFTDIGEIKFNLRSVAKHAPWVRKVVLVVADDSTLPRWLNTSAVQVTRHSEMFSQKEDLPTFNSHAIESRLHYIPGLAEHFIYANDDMFLNGPVSKSTFFTESGKPRVWARHRSFNHYGSHGMAVHNSMNLISRTHTMRTWPTGYTDLEHEMKALTKSSFQRAHERFRVQFDETAAHPFRHMRDVWAVWMASVWCVEEGRCEYEDHGPSSTFFDLPGTDVDKEFAKINEERPTFLCLNDADFATAAAFESNLQQHYPEKAPYELN